uniref:Phenylalanine--tRNA ligase n=1 Tax=Meloidogyne javanica TaxID=6303 RepID=A0A915NAL1_MELJA
MNNRPEEFKLDGVEIGTQEEFWNLGNDIIQMTTRNLLKEKNQLSDIKNKIVKYFEGNYRRINISNNVQTFTPIFKVFEDKPRIIPVGDLKKSYLLDESIDHTNIVYSLNKSYCLRMSTHDHIFELFAKCCVNFIVYGAGFNKIANCFPCLHSLSGVRTFTATELFGIDNVRLFFEDAPPNFSRSAEKQNIHKTRTVEKLQEQMKATLINLFTSIFAGTRLEGAELSFTVNINRCTFCHPVYDIKVRCDGTFKELCNVGVIDQRLLSSAGITNRVGFVFLMVLENISNILHNINNPRIYWDPQNSPSPDIHVVPDGPEYGDNLLDTVLVSAFSPSSSTNN